ncbi:hypothetical protein EP073_03545 [Geovibrio thiophilus]|uniref:Peptidase-C39 like family protein n=1 Tax=Geovibrio thiophilus TaxID=139438 RepID=A0A3R5UXZ2_9BACT|nr:C39 family peptidase [Geovibrio thiophilus]QAR32509.1 hypothetical protein EP073_03545 [Geovibrio thiophilus]
MNRDMNISILPQPDDTSCGPTCLHAVYSYYGEDIELSTLRDEITELETGGTLAVILGLHALKKGYKATIYSYNLMVFDPTWFRLPPDGMIKKLKMQMEVKNDSKLRYTSKKYIEFLTLGGELKFADLSPALIRKYLDRQTPIITALSATYLYRSPREIPENTDYDDLRGEPSGHFVVITGYDKPAKKVSVADPMLPNPFMKTSRYSVRMTHLINAILLGVLTYDAKLLVIEKNETDGDVQK